MSKALELAKFGRESAPAGAVIGDTDTQTLSSKTFSDGPVFSGLTANGIPYLNASKVLSSSSTFVFDGTNIGIGIASPAYKLDVRGQDARLSSGATGSYAIFRVGGAGSDSIWGYAGANNDVSTGSSAGDTVFGSNKASANLRFLSGNGAITMTLNSSGNLGVGIASPTAIIHTQSSGLGDGGGIKLGNSGSGGGTFAIWPTATINGEGANKLIFSGSGGNLVTITGAGNVGVGTTNPSYLLDVNGAGRFTANLYIAGTGDLNLSRTDSFDMSIVLPSSMTTANKGLVIQQAGGGNIYKFAVSAATTTMSGDVGIGTSTPYKKSHIVGGALAIDSSSATASGVSDAGQTNNLLYLRTPYSSNAGSVTNNGMKWGIRFVGRAGDNVWGEGKAASIYAVSEEDSNAGYNRKVGLSFWTSGFDQDQAERLRIDNNGRVIINPTQATNSVGMLDIYGGGGATTLGAIRIGDGTYAGGHVNYWDIGRDNNVSGDFTFALNASEKMRIQTNGNVAIGDTTAGSYKLKVAGTLGVTGAAVISSYATVGSIVANDPGSSYYSYNNRIGGNLAVVGTLYNVGNLYSNRFTLNQGSSGTTRTAGTVNAGWYRFARSDFANGGYGARGGGVFYMYTTGGWSGPGQTVIEFFKDYSTTGNLTVDVKGNYYFTNWRIAMDNNYAYLEGYTNGFNLGGDNTFNTIIDAYGWDSGGWTLYTEALTAGLTSPSYVIKATSVNLNGVIYTRHHPSDAATNTPDDYVTVIGRTWQSGFTNPVIDILSVTSTPVIYDNLICEVEVWQTPWSNNSTGSVHIGYANYGNQGNIKNVTTMVFKGTMPSGSQSNVGTLSWNGNILQYTSNRASNYDHYSMKYTVRNQECGVVYY